MGYQRATIMDAFNAVNHFGQQALGYMDAYKREEADAFMRNIPAEFQMDMQNHMRDNPFNYQGDPDNKYGLEDYTREYIAEMNDYADKWYKDKFGGKGGIGYYARAKEQMQAQAKISTRNMALEKQDEWRVQRGKIRLEENNRKYIEGMNNGDLTPEEALTAIYNNIDMHGIEFEINPHVKNEMRKANTAAVFQEYASSEMGKEKYVSGLESAMERINKVFSSISFLKPEKTFTYDKDGNVTGSIESPWSFDKKDEYEKALIQQHTNRIHKQNENKILEADAVYRALMEKAARGDTTAAWEAERIAAPYRRGVQNDLRYGKKVTEYADGFKDVIPGLFGEKDGRGSGHGGGSGNLDLSSLDYTVLKMYEGIVFGTAGVSFNELSEGKGERLVAPLKAEIWALAAAGDPIHQRNKQWIEQNGDSALLSHIGFSILENPEKYLPRLIANNAGAARYLSNDALDVIKAEARRSNKIFDRREGRGKLNQEQLFNMWDLIRDCAREDNNGLSDREYIDLIDRELDLIIVNGISESRKAKVSDENSMAKAMWKWQEDPNAVFTFGTDTPRYRNESFKRDAEEWTEKERDRLTARTGKPLRFVKYDQEPGKQSDIHVKGIYEDVDGNQYRSVAVSSDGGRHVTIRDERRQLLEDGRLGDWQPCETRSAAGTREEPSALEEARERRMDEAEARSKFVSNGKIPADKNGNPVADWKTLDRGMQVQFLEDWSRDPNRPAPPPSGVPYPAEEWKERWKGMNQKERLNMLFEIYGSGK